MAARHNIIKNNKPAREKLMLSKICKTKNLLSVCILLLLVYMFLEPQRSLEASQRGLLLWAHTLLPTLLPFMILSSLVIRIGTAERLLAPFAPFFRLLLGLSPAGTYCYLMGLLCGYPMGAKLAADLYREERISQSEARYLLTFCNNPSPVFVTTYLLLQCLHMPQYTLATFAILYSADLATSLVFRIRYRPGGSGRKRKEIPPLPSIGKLLDISIMNAFGTITRLGGFIILFSVLSAALGRYLPRTLGNAVPCLLGLLEISTGLEAIAASSMPAAVRYTLSICAASLGGLCILAQTCTVLEGSRLPLRPYLEGKIVNASFTLLFSLLFLKSIQVI